MLPGSLGYSQSDSNLIDTCGVKITKLENQVAVATDSSKILHFIEKNSTEFKSLKQNYALFWLNTSYTWKTDVLSCSANLVETTVSFQLSNSSNSFIGVAHFTVNPSISKVAALKVDIPNSISSR